MTIFVDISNGEKRESIWSLRFFVIEFFAGAQIGIINLYHSTAHHVDVESVNAVAVAEYVVPLNCMCSFKILFLDVWNV